MEQVVLPEIIMVIQYVNFIGIDAMVLVVMIIADESGLEMLSFILSSCQATFYVVAGGYSGAHVDRYTAFYRSMRL